MPYKIQTYNTSSGNGRVWYPCDFLHTEFTTVRVNSPKTVTVNNKTFNVRNINNGLEISGASDSIDSLVTIRKIFSALGFTDFNIVERGSVMPKAFTANESNTYAKTATATTPNITVNITVSGNSKNAAMNIVGSGSSIGSTASYWAPADNFAIVQPVLFKSNDFFYYGVLATTRSQIYLVINTNVTSNNFVNPSQYAGDKIDSRPDPLGGDGEYDDMEGDSIDMPDAPDESVSGVLANGFLNIYKPSDANLRAFGAALWTNAFNVKWTDIDSVSNLILNAVSNPIDFIIGLFMLPVTPSVGGSSGIYLGGINVNTVSAPRVTSQWVTIDFGTIEINELYASYLDYANSRVSIYLPYVGTADIDVQEINGGRIWLRYIVDVFTGACVANVHCTKATLTPWGVTYTNETVHSYSGNMALQLPISAGSFDTMTQGLINVGLGLGTNTPAVAMQGGKEVLTGLGGDVTTRGSLSSNTGKLGYQTPYLMFTRPIETRPANLGSLHGYSAGVGGILNQFKGFVVCSDVKLDGVTATDSELNEIESILKSGVYV
jgi:hypothetical protein